MSGSREPPNGSLTTTPSCHSCRVSHIMQNTFITTHLTMFANFLFIRSLALPSTNKNIVKPICWTSVTASW